LIASGDLKVLVNREEVWKRQQINRKLWQRGSLHFVANSTYQITIEASVPSALVTVALDDLEVIENCTKTDYGKMGF
jgi:MAM domain.